MARPRIPLISRTLAVETALALIDSEGLDNMSVTRLAAALRCQAPSLYHHFSSKDDILRSVARRLLRDIPPLALDRFGDATWEEILIDKAWASYLVLTSHPNATPLVFEYYPHQIVAEPYDEDARLFTAAGIPPEYHVLLWDGLEKFVFGAAMAKARGQLEFAPFNVAQYPLLDQSLRANPFDEEALFRLTCTAFFRGVTELISQSTLAAAGNQRSRRARR